MANFEDVDSVRSVVGDATLLLDWTAGPEVFLVNEAGEVVPLVSEELRPAYAAAVEQAHATFFGLALDTLRGRNPNFPLEQVLAALDEAAWSGPLRQLKVQILEAIGLEEVMELPRARRTGAIAGGVFRRVIKGLNVALGSLGAIPGVGPIKELKDFLETMIG